MLTSAPYVATPAPGDWYTNQIHTDEGLLVDGLARHGLTAIRVDWADPAVDWSQVRCAVFRSTWDYFHRFGEFQQWLDATAALTRFVNHHSLLRWNVDKHYLADLERSGVPIVPTIFVDSGSRADLAVTAGARGWDEVVVKPVVSGAARETYRLGRAELAAFQAQFDALCAAESMMIQPFQPEVLAVGELSLMVIGGRFTHAVRKIPKSGDFRVQDDHGGTAHPHEATRDEVAFAELAVAACPSPPQYARVDLVDTPEGCRLMELELVEPELFFRFHPPAAYALADAVAEFLTNHPGLGADSQAGL